jgi:hypothetical protein
MLHRWYARFAIMSKMCNRCAKIVVFAWVNTSVQSANSLMMRLTSSSLCKSCKSLSMRDSNCSIISVHSMSCLWLWCFTIEDTRALFAVVICYVLTSCVLADKEAAVPLWFLRDLQDWRTWQFLPLWPLWYVLFTSRSKIHDIWTTALILMLYNP